jgi:SAM-dependent methyltransferase
MAAAQGDGRETPACVCGETATTARSTSSRDEGSGETFRYCECAACGLERLSPRPTPSEIGRYYPDTYYAYHADETGRPPSLADRIKRLTYQSFYAHRTERAAWVGRFRWLFMAALYPLRHKSVLAFAQPEVRRVFEFGAATGNDLVEFRSAGWEVAGCEPSAQACAVAARRGITLQNCSAEDAELPRDFFSCIYMNNVFEHLHDPPSVLRKCYDALIGGGLLILVVPNHASWSARIFGSSWPGYDPPRHLWGFSPRPIRKLLEASGFRVECVNHRFSSRWCWMGSIERRGPLPGPPRLQRLAARMLPVLLTPAGMLAAGLRHGDFLRVVACKP